MFECKRVGVEDGMKKGPQTIEKAKQGSYVAKSVSSLHKIRTRQGVLKGLVYLDDQKAYTKNYTDLLAEIIASDNPKLLDGFVLTIGVVSNHGNWFTSDNHNKELKVLAQSYDWLLFLTDTGLSEFITELLLEPVDDLNPARDAFISSYSGSKTKNRFTKVQMDLLADFQLQKYFSDNKERIEGWFNVITPTNSSIDTLKLQIDLLKNKDWKKVYSL